MNHISALSESISGSTSAREKILFTAHDLFYRDGIRATGVDRLIAESKVTKTTFYRHFPSKNNLILEFLELRHQNWLTWFEERLDQHGGTVQAIKPSLEEWFSSNSYRGCAFINSLGELGEEQAEVKAIVRRHKQDVADVLVPLMPARVDANDTAKMIALMIDGAIIKAQYDFETDAALSLFDEMLSRLLFNELQ